MSGGVSCWVEEYWADISQLQISFYLRSTFILMSWWAGLSNTWSCYLRQSDPNMSSLLIINQHNHNWSSPPPTSHIPLRYLWQIRQKYLLFVVKSELVKVTQTCNIQTWKCCLYSEWSNPRKNHSSLWPHCSMITFERFPNKRFKEESMCRYPQVRFTTKSPARQRQVCICPGAI